MKRAITVSRLLLILYSLTPSWYVQLRLINRSSAGFSHAASSGIFYLARVKTNTSDSPYSPKLATLFMKPFNIVRGIVGSKSASHWHQLDVCL